MDKTKILYIESDEIQRKTLAGRLRKKGYEVIVASSGPIGLRWFEKKIFDVVLCGHNMPKMDGMEVLEEIRRKDSDIPFIIFSARGTVTQARKAVKKGASHFVLKPKDVQEIIIIIEQVIEKGRLQKNLQDSRAALQLVTENVPDIIYSLNPKGEFISLSPSAESTMGYKPSELIGASVFKVIHPDDRQRVKESFMRTAESVDKKDKILQFRMVTKTGKIKHFEIKRKIAMENGRMTRNDGIARDITHRIMLEQKLKEYHQQMVKANLDMQAVQEELKAKNAEMEILLKELSKNKDELQTIIDSIPYVIFLVDQDGIIKASNRSVADYFDLSPDEVINRSFDEFIEKIKSNFEDFDRFYEEIENCKKTPDCAGQLSTSDIYRRGIRVTKHKPGILSPSCFRVQDKNNKETGLVWVYTDVSFIKHADEQVHTIVDASPIPTIISRLKDGKILYANDELASLAGLTSQELIGQNTPDFYYRPEDRKIVVESLQRDGYLRNFETQIKKVNGQVIWMIFSLVVTQIGGEEVVLGWLYDISERKKAEEALERERNLVSAILDTAGALVVVLDTSGRIVRFNRACEQVTGYASLEVVGKLVWDIFIIPEEIERVKGVFQELKSSHFPNKAENHWITKKGDRRLIAWSNTALLDDKDSIEFIIGTGIDITEQREAEEAIVTRLRYEEGVAACSQALWKDSATQDAVSESLYHLLKASNTSRVYIFENFEDPEDGLCLRLTHEVCAPGVSSNLDDPLLQHGPYKEGFERWRNTLSQGKPIQGFMESFPESERIILDPQGILSILVLPLWVEGQWYGFIGFDDVEIRREWSQEDIRLLQTAAKMVGDYIERKRFEEALRVSEERFRSLVENANDVIYSLTPKGEITYISPKFIDLLGYEISDYQGKPFSLLMHPDDVKKSVELFQRGLKSGRRESDFEFRMKHKNGTLRWFVSSSSAILDEQGKVVEIVGVAHDITEMKKILDDLERTNETLRETQAQLVQSEKMASLGSLVAGIAHEINTPIGAVSSMYDTLSRTLDRLKDVIQLKFPREYEQVPGLKSAFKVIDDSNNVIRTGTERVVNLVRRLKSFARLDEAELKTVDIHEGLEDTLTLLHHELKHNIRVIKNFGDIPSIACFPGQLNQVFLNLLINSKQAIIGKGTIRITTYVKVDKVHIVFKDNGAGISKANLKKIFDPGFTTKGRGVGAGLGLSICYQIIQAHRGEIRVESEIGKGATFTIILPTDLEEVLEKERTQA